MRMSKIGAKTIAGVIGFAAVGLGGLGLVHATPAVTVGLMPQAPTTATTTPTTTKPPAATQSPTTTTAPTSHY